MARIKPNGIVLEGKYKGKELYANKYGSYIGIGSPYEAKYIFMIYDETIVNILDMGRITQKANPEAVLKMGFWFGSGAAIVANQIGTQDFYTVAVEYNNGERSLLKLDAFGYEILKTIEFSFLDKNKQETFTAENIKEDYELLSHCDNKQNEAKDQQRKEELNNENEIEELSEQIEFLEAKIDQINKDIDILRRKREKKLDSEIAVEKQNEVIRSLEEKKANCGVFKRKEKSEIQLQIDQQEIPKLQLLTEQANAEKKQYIEKNNIEIEEMKGMIRELEEKISPLKDKKTCILKGIEYLDEFSNYRFLMKIGSAMSLQGRTALIGSVHRGIIHSGDKAEVIHNDGSTDSVTIVEIGDYKSSELSFAKAGDTISLVCNGIACGSVLADDVVVIK